MSDREPLTESWPTVVLSCISIVAPPQPAAWFTLIGVRTRVCSTPPADDRTISPVVPRKLATASTPGQLLKLAKTWVVVLDSMYSWSAVHCARGAAQSFTH